MTIYDTLDDVKNAKGMIKTALEFKGIDTSTIPFTDYPNLISYSGSADYNCVIHWPLATNSTNRITDTDATLNGTPDYMGDCTYFNGSFSLEDTTSLATLFSSLSNVSFSIWAYGDELNAIGGTSGLLYSCGSNCLNCYVTSGTLTICGYNLYSTITLSSAGITNTNDIFNIIVRVTSGVPTLFVNGVQKTVSEPTSVISQPANLCVGADDIPYFFYTGRLANFRAYDYVVTDEQIESIYNEGYHIRDYYNVTDGLVHYYPLRGSGEDLQGVANGTELGTPTYSLDSEFGVVSVIDSAGEGFDLSSVSIATNFSFSVWAKKTSTSTISYILDANPSSNRFIFSLDNPTVNENVNFYDGAWKTTGFTPTLNVWYHYSFTVEGTALKFYVDGEFITSLTLSSSKSLSSPMTLFGHYLQSESPILNGLNARFYNKVLTDLEIQKIYLREKHIRPIAIDEGLKCYLPLRIDAEDHTENQYTSTPSATITYDGQSAFMDDKYLITNKTLSSNTFTYSIWAKKPDSTKAEALIGNYGLYSGGMQGGHFYHYNSNHASFPNYLALGIDDVYARTSSAVDLTYFRHCVVTFSASSEIKIYVDGELVSTMTGFYAINYAHTIYIGAGGAQSTVNTFSGNLANARVYERVLSGDEIKQIYNSEKGDFQ